MTWLDLFHILFPLVMIVLPGFVMSLITFNRNADTNRRRALGLLAGLWAATVLAIGAWVALYIWTAPRTAQHLWVFFFPLWFGFWRPLMKAKNPDWASTPPPDLPLRSASLKVRKREPAVPNWAVWSMWALWGAGLLLILLLVNWEVLASADDHLRSRRIMGWTAILAMFGLAFMPALVTIILRAESLEPQPMDPGGSVDLELLYARRRRQRAWLFIGMEWALILLFTFVFTGLALMSRGAWPEEDAGRVIAWAGAIGGTIIGIAGAVFGTMSSIQAARINAKLRELSQAGA